VRRIALSVLAGVALIGATVVILQRATASSSQPVARASVQLVAVAPSGLVPRTAPGRAAGKSGLDQRLAQFLATHPLFLNPVVQRAGAIPTRPRVRPSLPQGMTCRAATASGTGGCSIVPCAVYVAGSGTAAGACVSRPGRPPQKRWVSSADR
jgi:hypothetical protein